MGGTVAAPCDKLRWMSIAGGSGDRVRPRRHAHRLVHRHRPGGGRRGRPGDPRPGAWPSTWVRRDGVVVNRHHWRVRHEPAAFMPEELVDAVPRGARSAALRRRRARARSAARTGCRSRCSTNNPFGADGARAARPARRRVRLRGRRRSRLPQARPARVRAARRIARARAGRHRVRRRQRHRRRRGSRSARASARCGSTAGTTRGRFRRSVTRIGSLLELLVAC